jgi:hypothetical protein
VLLGQDFDLGYLETCFPWLEVVLLRQHLATMAYLHWELLGSPLQEMKSVLLETVPTLG